MTSDVLGVFLTYVPTYPNQILCNVRSMTRTVAVVVMLADYLPEMQRVHLITLIIMIGIVNSSARIHRQVFLSVCFNEIDRPTSKIDQGIVCY